MNEATEKLLGALRGALDEFEAADRPQVEFPFWCNNNSTPPDPVFVPDNAQPWVLHSNGRWSQALASSARFVELAPAVIGLVIRKFLFRTVLVQRFLRRARSAIIHYRVSCYAEFQ